MIINGANLDGLNKGFKTSFNKGFASVESHWPTVAMKVPSSTAENSYAWLGDMPGIREWIGDRVVHDLGVFGYTVRNRLFEETVAVARTTIEDDQYGIYGPIFEKLGYDTALHPEDLTFTLLASGFAAKCYEIEGMI